MHRRHKLIPQETPKTPKTHKTVNNQAQTTPKTYLLWGAEVAGIVGSQQQKYIFQRKAPGSTRGFTLRTYPLRKEASPDLSTVIQPEAGAVKIRHTYVLVP